MDVILDTNIYTALLRSQGRNIFSSNAFVELFTYLRRTESNLVVPGPVFHEITKEYSDLIRASVKKAQDSWATLQRNTMGKLTDCFPPKPDSEIKAFQEELLDLGTGFEVIVLEDYKNVALAEVVRRGVNRIRPANDNGEELRDVVIWLVTLNHAKITNSKVAFITDDGHFKGPDENLHPDLLEDIASQKVELLFYDSIPKFIRANSLEHSTVTADEIARIVDEAAIAGLVIERFKRARLEDVTVSEIEFQDAQKYKVADDAFYVEARCTTVVRYLEITTPFNPVWLSGAQVVPNDLQSFNILQPTPQLNPASFTSIPVFGGMGSIVPLSTMVPTTLRKNYEVVVTLVLSFRIVSNATQATEIIDIGISKITQLSDDAVVP